MSMKIKVSYESPQELHIVISALKPLGITWKTAKRQGDGYKRAYGCLKEADGSQIEKRELVNTITHEN